MIDGMIMILIRFPDEESKHKALAYLAGRFSFKSWASGDMVVPEIAVTYMAMEGIRFSVEGPAPYDKLVSPLRNPPAVAV